MIVINEESLRTKSELFEGTKEDLQSLVDCLEFDLGQSKIMGIGLSAIQIGIPKRVAIIRHKSLVKVHGQKRVIEDNYDLWNAEIIKKTNPFVFKGEGCLSIPGEYYKTQRYNEVSVKNGDGKIYKFSGLLAVAVQHELDHWDGVLISDRKVD